eukprot:gene10177-13874_t
MSAQRSTIKVAGESILTYNDKHFAKLRAEFGMDPDKILSANNFVFGDMKPGGGKGGDPMVVTRCKQYFVKEVSKDDQGTLISIAQKYVEHVLKGSLLVKFFLHFQRTDADGPKDYIVMNSCFPASSRTEDWSFMFDLKGTADDKTLIKGGEKIEEVHKRIANPPMWCCPGKYEGRKEYYDGKKDAFTRQFHVTAEQKTEIVGIIQLDTAWLKEAGLMDYSMMVGVRECPLDEYEIDTFASMKPFLNEYPLVSVHDGKVQAYYLGIIDFLQPWTTGKRVAHCIKCTFAPKPISTIHPSPYADQFLDFFTEKFTGQAHERTPLKFAGNLEPLVEQQPQRSEWWGTVDANGDIYL